MKKNLFFCIVLLCSSGVCAQSPAKVGEVYKKTLNNWHRSQARWRLRHYVPLVGLYPLEQGKNSFGSSPDNDIVINSSNAPLHMGAIMVKGDKISYGFEGKITAYLEQDTLKDLVYTFDADHNSEFLKHQFIRWYVQYVGDDYFLRVLDEQSTLVFNHTPSEYFAAHPDFIFAAEFRPYKRSKEIKLKNVIGTAQVYEFIGEVIFEYNEKKFQLAVMKGGLLLFTDNTNGDSTFPLGRYIRLDIKEDGPLILDFNYAFSPPRACSLYTTCDLPPAQNHLPFSVYAGEKYSGPTEGLIQSVGTK